MIDLEQKVETTWCPSNKDYLIKRGYIFTKYKDKIVIKAKDLMPRSEKCVDVVCDYCLNTVSTKFCNYMMSTKDGVEKYSCKKCKGIKAHEKNYDKNIYFIPEHSFHDCRDKNALPFDFYLPDYNCCIEFDGQGHYEPIFGEESYLTTIKHDKIKNNYCEINNIKIVRIPFWEANNASKIISNALRLKKYPIVINYNKNPYE